MGKNRDNINSLIFTTTDALIRGFKYIAGLDNITSGDCRNKHIDDFKSHYGTNPTRLSFLWCDLITSTDIGLEANDRSEKGFKQLLIALHFLWAYPKNATILASTFAISKGMVD